LRSGGAGGPGRGPVRGLALRSSSKRRARPTALSAPLGGSRRGMSLWPPDQPTQRNFVQDHKGDRP
jgi:hypothetical protein